jgi:hypothetical protein
MEPIDHSNSPKAAREEREAYRRLLRSIGSVACLLHPDDLPDELKEIDEHRAV